MLSLLVSFSAATPAKSRRFSTHSLNLLRMAFKNEIMTPLSILSLMYRIAHIHQIDAKVQYQPKGVEE
jgi:hypothetical protein